MTEDDEFSYWCGCGCGDPEDDYDDWPDEDEYRDDEADCYA